MNNRFILASLVVTFCCVGGLRASPDAPVELRPIPGEDRVEVWIGGRLFTAYRFGAEFKLKPVFYPVNSPGGNAVNRELPFIRDSGETTDHHHQQSLGFGYGELNGYDFWSHRGGETIVHRAVLGHGVEGGKGRLEVLLDWRAPDGTVLARELRTATFGGGNDHRWMDHDISLQALDRPLDFIDSKEGMFAIRLADALRERGGSGRYENAFGWETERGIWGKRAPWVALRGEVSGEEVTVAIFEHPASHNYPSYWHARAYGLFAINPFGRKDFVEGAEPLNDRLAPRESFHFRYRVVIYGGKVEKERLDTDYWSYIQ
jgi:hypothetical protein